MESSRSVCHDSCSMLAGAPTNFYSSVCSSSNVFRWLRWFLWSFTHMCIGDSSICISSCSRMSIWLSCLLWESSFVLAKAIWLHDYMLISALDIERTYETRKPLAARTPLDSNKHPISTSAPLQDSTRHDLDNRYFAKDLILLRNFDIFRFVPLDSKIIGTDLFFL